MKTLMDIGGINWSSSPFMASWRLLIGCIITFYDDCYLQLVILNVSSFFPSPHIVVQLRVVS